MKNSWAVCCSRVTKNDIGALPCLWTREVHISCVWGPLVYEWCWFLPLKRSKPTKSVRLTPATTLVLSTFVAIRQGSDRCEPLTLRLASATAVLVLVMATCIFKRLSHDSEEQCLLQQPTWSKPAGSWRSLVVFVVYAK